MVAILKTARQIGLYQDLGCVSVPGEGSVTIPERLLQRAVASRVESLQVDALQLACVHPRTTSLPGEAMSTNVVVKQSTHCMIDLMACSLSAPLSFPPACPTLPHPRPLLDVPL